MSIVNETITKFSFIGSLKPQENFNRNLKVSIGLLAGFSSAVVAGAGLMYRWTNSVTEAIDPTIQLSRETGEAVETIQALGYAASVNGSSLDAVSSSLSEVNKRMGEFVRTGAGPAAEVAIQLGLNLRKSNGEVKKASDVMLELNDKMSRFSRAEQSDILDKLGINPSMIQLLNKSDSAISSLMQKAIDLGVVNKEQADQLAAYNDANTTLRFGLKSLQNQIAVGLTPALMDLVGGFTDWLASNKDLVKNMATSFGKGILVTTQFISRMKFVALGAAAAFGVWKVATLGLGKALALAFTPVTLITAGIVGAVLAIDDLIVAFNGGKSVIRDFIMEWTGFDIRPALIAGVEAVKNFGVYVLGLGKQITGSLGNVFSGIFDIWNGDFKKGFDGLLAGVSQFVGVFKDMFVSAISFIAEQISNLIPPWIKEAYQSIGSVTSSAGNAVSGALDSASNAAGSAYDSAVDWGRSLFSDGGTTNNSAITANLNQTNDIKIYSSDPVSAGQTVADFSSKQMRDAVDFYDKGGR